MAIHQTLAGQLLVECQICKEPVPQGHTMLRPELGRICWFCYTDECVDPDPDDDFDDYDDDDGDWDDWDD